MSFVVRNSRFPHMCRALLRFPHLSFIPPVPYPPLRGTFPSKGRLYVGDSGTLVNGVLETIYPLSFIPLVPYPPLRGTFPLRGRLCIGNSGTLANGVLEMIYLSLSYRHCPIRLTSLATFPLRGRLYVGDSDARVYDALETIFSLSFIPLVPYPARSARHLPHAGKTLCRGQRHSHKCRACILCKQKPLCEDWLCRAVSGSIIPRSRILRDFSAYPHHFLS